MSKKKNPPSCSEAERWLFLNALDATEDEEAKRPEPKAVVPKEKPKHVEKQPTSGSNTEFLDFLNQGLASHPDFIQKRDHSPSPKAHRPKAAARPTGPEAVIDLHACTLEQALTRTEEFLLRCQLKKFRKVLIIHGKGSGILKEGVRKYLSHHASVAQMEEAERQHGGSGAVMVILRR